MSFLKKIGFFEEKEEPKKKTIPPPKPVMDSVVIPTIPADAKSKIDYNQHLVKVMKETNLQGPDYLEFSEAISKLEGKPLTEQQKYENIFTSFDAMGVKAQTLVSSANHYINRLIEEKAHFDDELKKERQLNIIDKNNAIKADEKLLKELSEKIQKNKLEVESATQLLAVEESSFNIAFDQRVNIINNQINNIQNFLINGNTQS